VKPVRNNRVDIILFKLEGDPVRHDLLYQLLSEDEKLRASRFRFDKHRNRFIFGRGAIREILAGRVGCQPREISFELNQFGKPGLSGLASDRCLEFNASSSECLGAIAVSESFVLGLDIEKIKQTGLEDFDLVVKSEFAESEIDWYQQQDEEQRIQAFYRLWTCKEAYLKALGIGLSGKLDSFTIELSGPEPTVLETSLEDNGQSKFFMLQQTLADGYIACLALPTADQEIEISYWK
jgi:4'-phosphopantetheinyl transferase